MNLCNNLYHAWKSVNIYFGLVAACWAHPPTAPDFDGNSGAPIPIRRVSAGISTPAGPEAGAPEAVGGGCAPRHLQKVLAVSGPAYSLYVHEQNSDFIDTFGHIHPCDSIAGC